MEKTKMMKSVGVLNQIIACEGDCAGITCFECPLCEAYDCGDVERSTREILEKALEVRNNCGYINGKPDGWEER